MFGVGGTRMNTNRVAITKSKPTVVVGLDFGTTFSGFAYAIVSEPDRVHKFYEWPEMAAAGGKNYCKTPTSLLYVSGEGPADSYILEDWGYAAIVKHANNLQAKQQRLKQARAGNGSRDKVNQSRPRSISISGKNDDDSHRETLGSDFFVSRFKLLLAGNDPKSFADIAGINLPNGITARGAISDFLLKLSEQVLTVLQNSLGNHICMDDIQWCITVPAIWDEPAKQEMKACAEIAGMVQGIHCSDDEASPHPLIIVLEPEAASLYCQQKANFPLNNGDRFLVVDVGGGTVDLVLHEKVGHLQVREVSPSSGGLCGGTYVDQRFVEFLSQKIKCFRQFAVEHPESVLKLQGWWEVIKHGFDGNMDFAYELELPAKLARAWETEEKANGLLSWSQYDSFDAIDLSLEDMLTIFDPVMDKILELIESKMIDGVKAIMVVGGFSASPYLLKKITKVFSERVEAVIVPSEPGSAICCGAVSYAVRGADLVMSRISKKTYGISFSRIFLTGDPVHRMMLGPDGRAYCTGMFEVFVRNGYGVAPDQCVSRSFSAIFSDQTQIEICLYSTLESDPKYVDDFGVTKEGSFLINHPSAQELGNLPKFKVSLYFGHTLIEVAAVGRNFGKGETFVMAPVTFEKSCDL